jgi:endonuclease/exonuclease/phosphatase (EEP) superfamily protein YafD
MSKRHPLIRFANLFGGIAVAGSSVAMVASYHWIADLASQLRVQYLIMLLPVMGIWVWTRYHKAAVVGGLAMGVNLWFIVPYFIPQDRVTSESIRNADVGQGHVRLLLLNVLRTNSQLKETLREVRTHNADLVFLMEVSPDWKPILESVRAEFPHQKQILRDDYTGVAFLSKYPWITAEVIDTEDANPPLEIRFSQMAGQSQPFQLIATHPLPPISPDLTASRDSQLSTLAERCRSNPPSLLVGDFNLAPWSPRFEPILKSGQLTDASLGYGLTPTLTPLPTLLGGLKVDHVLVSRDVTVRDYSVHACRHSDHTIVIVDFRIESTPQPPDSAVIRNAR